MLQGDLEELGHIGRPHELIVFDLAVDDLEQFAVLECQRLLVLRLVLTKQQILFKVLNCHFLDQNALTTQTSYQMAQPLPHLLFKLLPLLVVHEYEQLRLQLVLNRRSEHNVNALGLSVTARQPGKQIMTARKD